MNPMFIDLEVENHKYYGSVASPRHPENYVVAVGTAIRSEAVQGQYFSERPQKFLSIPSDVDVIVAHNAPFEMDWFLAQEREEILSFLRRGGRVFCTAYAEYLLTNQQELYPSLDETAPKYGGTHKVDGIKVLWEQGYLTSQIDRVLLMEYLTGPSGDVENTRRVFTGQVALLQERDMLNMAFGRMEGMLYNCLAMDAGLFVDRSIAMRQRDAGEATLNTLRERFAQFRKHIPVACEFKDTSDYHMSAWLFGGPIKYREQDTWLNEDGSAKYEKVDAYQFGDTHVACSTVTPENFALYVAEFGPADRSKAGKNKGQPRVYRVDSPTPKLKWYDRVYQCPPLIALRDLPDDVQEKFKEEFTGKRTLSDGTPVFSTGSDCIELLSYRPELHDSVRGLMQDLLEFAKLDKDLGTYYLREDCDESGNVVKQSGMLQYLTPQNVVYHGLNNTSTVTGRLSSTRPNMQNLPRGDTSDVKNMFRSRYDDKTWLDWALGCGVIGSDVHAECVLNIDSGVRNGSIIEADYSALEVVTLAAFSKDTHLVRALLDNIDMHCMRLSASLGESYESVLQKCKDENHPDHKRYKSLRTAIKPKAFAYQYGATARGIAFATGCSVEEAQAFIDAEKALFPDVETYYEQTVFAAVESCTSVHREQTENGGWRVYKRGVFTAPGSTCYEFRQYPKKVWVNGQRIDVMEFKPTQMRNYPIQGESGFFVQVIAGIIMRWLVAKDFYNGKCFAINQVHDALYFDVHNSVLPEVAQYVKVIMESLPSAMRSYGYDLTVPFPCEVEAGPSMNEKSKVQ